jgi:DUF438 domain-containing protein
MLFDRMDAAMVQAMIEAIPLEITVIDAQDEVVGWNKHESRLFRRPMSCMGLNFRQCHPEESLDRVVAIVDEMKAGQRDRARFWIDLTVPPGSGTRHKVLIEFYALRDPAGRYLGCMECTQDVEEIRHLEGQERLLG